MVNAFVQAPDSAGKKIQTFENTIGIDVVEAYAVTLVQSNGTTLAPLTNTELRASAVPVSLAVDTPDVTDRAARVLGHVTVDNASFPVTGAFFQATQPVSGPVTDAQLRASAVKAREDTGAMTWVSVKGAAPAIGAVQADTGALVAGDYDLDIFLCASDTAAVGKGLVVEHRNAANAATLQTLHAIPAGVADNIRIRRYTIALNERIRVIAGTAAGAASSMYVSAIGRRIA